MGKKSSQGGRGKKQTPEAERAAQQRRTHKNKVKRFKKLLASDPQDKQAPAWKDKLEHSSKRYL